MQIWKLPPVLILHLKRFHYNTMFRDKGRSFSSSIFICLVCDMVHFPTQGLDMSPYVLGPGAGTARYEFEPNNLIIYQKLEILSIDGVDYCV